MTENNGTEIIETEEKSEKKPSLFDKWRIGELDTLSGFCEEPPKEKNHDEQADVSSRIVTSVGKLEERTFRHIYGAVCVVFTLLLIAVMLLTISNLPRYGGDHNPSINEVSQRYLEKGMEETGAVNSVAGMILDYRAFDTLGESFVLFTASCGVLILLREDKSELSRIKDRRSDRLCLLSEDPIVRVTCKAAIPIIMMLGVYVLLNGHLGPGGGFAGGAILGAGLILYTMVMGFERASAVLTRKRIKGVTVCALMFYCLIKSYSFFTGANHLPSLIRPGVPGRIFSAGVIMPLNVAVGMVVACTMYSFYAVFRRGNIS